MDADPDYRDAALLGLRLRGYRNAEFSKQQSPWVGLASPRSADAEILGDLSTLRRRARQLGRDDPIASGLINTFETNVVGCGIRAQSVTASNLKNNRIEAAWDGVKDSLFPAEDLPWFEVQRLLISRLLEDGEVFVKRSSVDDRPFFELIEGDRVETPLNAILTDPKGEIRSGVERDRYGRRTGYWIRKRHPGDTVLPTVTIGVRPVAPTLSAVQFDRVPAEDVRHLRLVNRPGQTRGVPMLHAVLQDLKDLDLLILAALKRVQVAACLAVFLESSESVSNLLDVTAQKTGYLMDQDLTPGGIFKLFPGEKVSTVNPNFPIPDLDVFVRLLARRIGASLGISWQIVLKDFSEANYSSARTDLLEARQTYTLHQRRLVDCALGWIRQSALEDLVLRGDLRASPDDIRAVSWVTPGWQWVDPQKEAAAAEIELRTGTTTLRDIAASKGKDWEEIMRQRSREKELAAELGVEETPAPSPAPVAQDEDEDEDEDEDDMSDARNRLSAKGMLV